MTRLRNEGAPYLTVIFVPSMLIEVLAGGLRGGGCAGREPPGGSSATAPPVVGPCIWAMAPAAASTSKKQRLIRLLLLCSHRVDCIVHVDELISLHRQTNRGAGRCFGGHLVPGHRRRIEHVAFNR